MKDGFTLYESTDFLKIVLREPKKSYVGFGEKFAGILTFLLFVGFAFLTGFQLYALIKYEMIDVVMIFLLLLSFAIMFFIGLVVKKQFFQLFFSEVVLMTPQIFQYSRTVMSVAFMKRTINLNEIDAIKVLEETELSEDIDENEEFDDPTDEEVEASEMSEEENLRILAEEQRLEVERVEKITLSEAFKKEIPDPKKDFKIEVANWRTPLYIGRDIPSWDTKTVVGKMNSFRAKHCR